MNKLSNRIERLESRALLTTLGFEPHDIFVVDTARPEDIELVDIDADGDLDVLVASLLDGKISWYPNNGDGSFESQREVGTGLSANDLFADFFIAGDLKLLTISDLDGDGLEDIIFISPDEGVIGWYENQLDSGLPFASSQTIGRVPRVSSVAAEDFDRDGDFDLFFGSSSGVVALFENYGDGSFSDFRKVGSEHGHVTDLIIRDLNHDGHSDLVVSDWTRGISWYSGSSDGGGFGENALITDIGYWSGFGDFDSDGDEDVVVSDNASSLTFFENSGTGDFRQAESLDASPAGEIRTGDFDGDGAPDILHAYGNFEAAFTSGISLYKHQTDYERTIVERSGIGRSSQPEIHIPTDLAFGDIDDDGDLGFVASFAEGHGVFAYKNKNGTGLFAPRVPITERYGDAQGGVFVADLDGDGDLDTIRESSWHENFDDGNLFREHRFCTDRLCDGAEYEAFDVDADGDLDLVECFDLWYENTDGRGTLERQSSGSGSCGAGVQVIADLDGDGRRDFLTGQSSGYVEIRFGNAPGLSATEPLVISNPQSSHSLSLAVSDLDGDDDLDIVAASSGAGSSRQIDWIENLGRSFAGRRRIFEDRSGGATRIAITDVDWDGDSDIIFDNQAGHLSWLENDGAGDFGNPSQIESGLPPDSISVFRSPVVANLDGDDDMDILANLIGDDSASLVWFEATSPGDFALPRFLLANTGSSYSLADMDQDNDLDIVVADNSIRWYENKLVGDVNDDGTVSFADFLLIAQNFGQEDATWRDGDMNADRSVSFADFLLLAQNYGRKRVFAL